MDRAKLWAVVKREYLERVRTKWFVVATIFGPLLLGALLIVPAVLANRSMKNAQLGTVEILDATGIGLGERVALGMRGGIMGDTSRVAVRTLAPAELAPAESLATRRVMNRQLTGYLVLDSLSARGERARYAGRNAQSFSEIENIERILRQSITIQRLEEAGVGADRARTIANVRLQLDAEKITDDGRAGSGMFSFIFAGGIAFLLYMSIVFYGQNVLRGVQEEKQTRVAEVVISSVTPETLLAGKVLGVGAVGVTQQVLWVISSFVMYHFRAPILERFGVPSPPISLPGVTIASGVLLLAYFVLGYAFYASLHAAVGAMVSDEREAQQAVQPVMLLLVATAIFIQPVLMQPTGQLATTLSYLPFSSPIIMPMRLALTSVDPLETAGSLVILLLSTAAVVWIAARIYRVGLLMYGKRPSLAELGRWIRRS